MTAVISALGRSTLDTTRYFGELAMLLWEALGSLCSGHIRWRLTMIQVVEIGLRSQIVVAVTGAFTGAVFAAQMYFQFVGIGLASSVGSAVAVSMFRELGPVLAGLMLSGRVGASIAAEIGTMKVTEQIDALRALAVHPVDYLVAPRLLAIMVCMPLLVAQCIVMGIGASYVVGVKIMGINGAYFMLYILRYIDHTDVIFALSKGFVFSILIATIACHQGMHCRDGAVGVGQATTASVVFCSLALLTSNFFLTLGLNILFPSGSW